jgi:hypothetical protein
MGPSVARTAGRWIFGRERLTCADITLGSPARSGRVQAKNFIVTSLKYGWHLQCMSYARIIEDQTCFFEEEGSIRAIATPALRMREHQSVLGSRHAHV